MAQNTRYDVRKCLLGSTRWPTTFWGSNFPKTVKNGLTGLPASTLAPLQRVLSAAARVVVGLGPRYHVTPSLCELHWLPIAARIDYKLCLLVHKSFFGQVPDYITELLTPAASDPSRSSLRSSSSSNLMVRCFIFSNDYNATIVSADALYSVRKFSFC